MDNLPLTLAGVSMGFISVVISIAALVIGIVALVRVNTLLAIQHQ